MLACIYMMPLARLHLQLLWFKLICYPPKHQMNKKVLVPPHTITELRCGRNPEMCTAGVPFSVPSPTKSLIMDAERKLAWTNARTGSSEDNGALHPCHEVQSHQASLQGLPTCSKLDSADPDGQHLHNALHQQARRSLSSPLCLDAIKLGT